MGRNQKLSVVFSMAVVWSCAWGAPAHGDDVLFSRLRLIIEFNSSAVDIGVQVLLDGDPWWYLKAFRPDGRKILDIVARRSLMRQGLTELFFESSEPELANVPLEVFFARFPEGVYEFEGVTVDGECIEGETTFTHVIPAGPVIVSPAQDDLPPVVDPNNLVISWEAVTKTMEGSTDLEIVGYQVIVEQVEPRRVFSIDLPGSTTSIRIPGEFFVQHDTLHKFEILAIETGGNQTITEGEFVTAP